MNSSPPVPSALPTDGQLAWQKAGFGVFAHFGINTFSGREWSDGTLDPGGFAPTELDADEWAETARDAGAAHLIVTAKHHDGFCLWQTDTTDYGVGAAPWRSGRGDVVAELAAACERAGIGLGVYLSPWDRNAPCYADPAAYDRFYRRQLTELCTRYGPLAEVWFDGAGSAGRTYDWPGVAAVLERHQPQAMVFNLGRPTIRWVGNEDGLAADPCWYTVERTEVSLYDSGEAALPRPMYLPPECDVSVRRHWFWHPGDEASLKSREHLLAVWYRSVGLGAGLLLNVPPDRRGRIDAADRSRLLEFTGEVGRRFADPLAAVVERTPGKVRLRFAEPVAVDHLELAEELRGGQRVTGHRITADGREVAAGGTVGVRRVHVFPEVRARVIEAELTGAAPEVSLRAFRTGHGSLPALEEQPPVDEGRADTPPLAR
ncbi:alpha-L-fucosidase [Streptomyces sp. CAS3]